MNNPQQCSSMGIELIKHFESYSDQAYQCPAGVWTIGWGTTRLEKGAVTAGMHCNKEQAEAWLKADLKAYEAGVHHLLKVTVAQHQFDALVSFAYNCGLNALRKSTLLQSVNHLADNAQVKENFLRWNKYRHPETRRLRISPGLNRRRKAEAHLYIHNTLNFYLKK